MRDTEEDKKNLLTTVFTIIIKHPYLIAYVAAVFCGGGSALLADYLGADLVIGSAVTFAGGFFGGVGTGLICNACSEEIPESHASTNSSGSDEEKWPLLIN